MMFHLVQTATAGFSPSQTDATYRASQLAQHLYQRVCLLGQLGQWWASLTRQSWRLLNLAEIEATCIESTRYSVGLQTVRLEQIRGSQGRCQDFDRHFYPLHDHLASRWMRVATAWHLGIALPPVELVQVGEIYFVRDGHHRISVAKAFGQTEINAEVRVWECS
jgi:hypothetical protein